MTSAKVHRQIRRIHFIAPSRHLIRLSCGPNQPTTKTSTSAARNDVSQPSLPCQTFFSFRSPFLNGCAPGRILVTTRTAPPSDHPLPCTFIVDRGNWNDPDHRDHPSRHDIRHRRCQIDRIRIRQPLDASKTDVDRNSHQPIAIEYEANVQDLHLEITRPSKERPQSPCSADFPPCPDGRPSPPSH